MSYNGDFFMYMTNDRLSLKISEVVLDVREQEHVHVSNTEN